MIDVPDQNVFVAIAAYREPELRRTIENCIITAAHPERLRFGVCLQYDLSGPSVPDIETYRELATTGG